LLRGLKKSLGWGGWGGGGGEANLHILADGFSNGNIVYSICFSF
jgi:hypothetical protein